MRELKRNAETVVQNRGTAAAGESAAAVFS
jgi:hypothetical protein